MTNEDGTRPYPAHDLAPELDELSAAYAQQEQEIAFLRAQLVAYRTSTNRMRAALHEALEELGRGQILNAQAAIRRGLE